MIIGLQSVTGQFDNQSEKWSIIPSQNSGGNWILSIEILTTFVGVKIPSTIANIKYFIIILFCSNNSQIYWEGLNNPIPVIILNKEGLDNPIPVDILYWEGLYNAIPVDIEANWKSDIFYSARLTSNLIQLKNFICSFFIFNCKSHIRRSYHTLYLTFMRKL